MNRAAILVLFLLAFASPAAAQWGESPSLHLQYPALPTPASSFDAAPSGDTLSAARSQHASGMALMLTGLSANIGGAVGSIVSIVSSFATENVACVRGSPCGPTNHTDWGGILAASLVTSGVGLVMFFIGLALDVHAHVLRGHVARGEAQLSITPNGVALTF